MEETSETKQLSDQAISSFTVTILITVIIPHIPLGIGLQTRNNAPKMHSNTTLNGDWSASSRR